MYLYGLNILSDKLRALNARHQERWIKLAAPAFKWRKTKGTPRPADTYRAVRREDTKWLRREAKRS